ncbi:hypothetical protein [Paenibacillus glacialis]|uniref:Sporulation protein YjcZ n=1 Tax=Paenibacillus glacialis TaxID=494026 RepID=A0A168D512_9BACL|nr:hypothetical protein PGLA_23435 [Paenibacillus glacialis]
MGEVLGGYGCGNNIGPNVGPNVGPIAGGCCPVGGFGLGGSTGAILVLFILLVIITKALWV